MASNEKTYLFSERALDGYIKTIQKLAKIEERDACLKVLWDFAKNPDVTPKEQFLLARLADLILDRGAV